MKSVLQDWVMKLPLRYQGGLIVATRGCDTAPKYGDDGNVVDSQERRLTQFLRWCVLVAADAREVDVPGAFFQSRPPIPFKPSALGHYPLHYVMHLVHAFEIVAREHPDDFVSDLALQIYTGFVHSFHLNPETPAQMRDRLTEDRIAKNNVVS